VFGADGPGAAPVDLSDVSEVDWDLVERIGDLQTFCKQFHWFAIQEHGRLAKLS